MQLIKADPILDAVVVNEVPLASQELAFGSLHAARRKLP